MSLARKAGHQRTAPAPWRDLTLSRRRLRPDSATGRQLSSGWRGWPVSAACRRRCGPGTRRAVDVVRPGFGLGHDGLPALLRLQRRNYSNGAARAVYGDDEPGPFGPNRLGGIMSDTPLAGRVAVVSGGGRGLGRSFCRALARQGAKVVVNNRNRVTDVDGRGPADHVAAEIVAGGGDAVATLRRGRPGRRGANRRGGGGALGADGHLRGHRGPGRDGGDAPGRLRPDHPGR